MSIDRSTVRHGVIAGLVGAATVALWFLIIDVFQGRPFYTPGALGSAVLLGARSPEAVVLSPGIITAYTVIHIIAFIAVGIIAAQLVSRAESEPDVLIGVVLLFVTIEVFTIGLIAIAAAWLLRTIPWWTVIVANLIAAIAMGVYLWKAYPGLRAQLRSDDAGDWYDDSSPITTPRP